MAAIQLTTQQKQEAVDAYATHGNDADAAKALGLSEAAYKSRKRAGIKAGLDSKIVVSAPTGHRIKGVSTLYTANGAISGQWVKTTADDISLEEKVEAITAAFAEFEPRTTARIDEIGPMSPDLATVYPIADWHVGLLAWNKETGSDWDLPIAKAVIEKTMLRLFSITPQTEQAVILGLGDLLHSDGYENTTARSKNLLDVDGRWPKVLRVATELLIFTVEQALLHHNKVLVRILPGNHDEESAIAVALALGLFYSGNPRVEVDADPSRFWWWRWGKVFLGATHGDKAKMKDLPLLMAARNPEDWGAAKFRHILTGHIHTDTAIEQAGVRVESFQTPVAPDAWHNQMGYGAGRSVQAIVFDKDLGEISRLRSNIITE